MRAACQVLLALVGVVGVLSSDSALSFRTDMETNEVEFNPQETSDIFTAMLTDSVGIVCYNDWKNPEEGQCNAIDFSDPANPKTGSETVLTSTKSQRFTVSRFSDNMGVACYSTFGSQAGLPACNTLTISGSGNSVAISAGADHYFDPNSTFPYTMSVVGLSAAKGVLCYQDTSDVYGNNRRDLVCKVLTVEGTSLTSAEYDWPRVNKTYVNAVELDNIVSISTTKLSDTVAAVCYTDGTEEVAICNRLELTDDADDVTVGPAFSLSGSAGSIPESSTGSVSIATLSDTWPPVDATKGVACYCNNQDGPTCVPLAFTNGTEAAGDALTVGTEQCSEVSVTGMSETGAIVCYLSGSNKVGVCSGLVLNHGNTLEMGDPTEIPATGNSNNLFVQPPTCNTNPCDQWISIARRDGSNAVACYAGVGGSDTGRCRGLRIPEPTTTSTATTFTETSSTTEHTTSESSTTTDTETSSLTSTTTASSSTVTTTTETSSTTPHTTTNTETSMTTQTEQVIDSGAPSAKIALCFAAALASWMLA